MYIGQGMMLALFIAWIIVMWDHIRPQLLPCGAVLAVILIGGMYYVTGVESPAHFAQMWLNQDWPQHLR